MKTLFLADSILLMRVLTAFACFALCSILSFAQTWDITDFGAIGNGSTVNTNAIQDAIDSCAIAGGTVLVPSGTFVTGTIMLKSNVNLRVVGTLKGSTNISHYPDMIPALRSLADENSQKSIIYAENRHNISITGTGTVDGNGFSFLGANERPYGIRIISCQNVMYDSIELVNAAFWMMHNLDVDSLAIRNVTVSNNSNSNNDGIGIDACRNVLIENCTVSSLDDPLVLKTTTPLNCENVVIRNCTVSTVARAIKIGTETTGGFRNILIEDCVVQPHSIIPTADCGMNLSIVDGGFIDSLTLRNITMAGVNTALFLRLGNQGRKYTPAAPTPPVGYIRNVSFQNITITAESNLTSSITGIPGYYVEDVTLEDVTVNFPGGEQEVRPGYIVPENETDRPNCDIFGDTIPAQGLYARHVKNLKLSNVCFEADAADLRPALVTEDVIESPQYEPVQTGSRYCLSEIASGIEKVNSSEIIISPDPQTGSVNIRFSNDDVLGNALIEIFDITGRKLFEENAFLQNGLNAGFYSYPGIYFCMVTCGAKKFTGKFKW